MSFSMCGSDNRHWVGYFFEDIEPEDEDFPDLNFDYEGVHDDPISLGHGPDANIPIWNLREYFLIELELRIAKLLTEWESVVRTVQRSILRYVCQIHSPYVMYFAKLQENLLTLLATPRGKSILRL
jgi:hypothetical protein